MAITKVQTASLYRRRAYHYDAVAHFFDRIGLTSGRYREEAVAALGLRAGSRVLDIGCGTGLNLPLLERAVGPTGTIFGVDLTDEMLIKACERVRRAGWHNVRLSQADAAEYEFPPALDGIVSTFALTLVPEFDDVVRRASWALPPGGKLAVLDFKRPARAPTWLVRLGALVNRPFGVTIDLASRRPWESVAYYFSPARMVEYHHGLMYLCVGDSPRRHLLALGTAAPHTEQKGRHV